MGLQPHVFREGVNECWADGLQKKKQKIKINTELKSFTVTVCVVCFHLCFYEQIKQPHVQIPTLIALQQKQKSELTCYFNNLSKDLSVTVLWMWQQCHLFWWTWWHNSAAINPWWQGLSIRISIFLNVMACMQVSNQKGLIWSWWEAKECGQTVETTAKLMELVEFQTGELRRAVTVWLWFVVSACRAAQLNFKAELWI